MGFAALSTFCLILLGSAIDTDHPDEALVGPAHSRAILYINSGVFSEWSIIKLSR